ncbi:hypothetical protein N185_08665 [Sinorhizobium sp. GW3]|nr:hypothetical protein N185_08665 [Sinorhizobium sp. GW3]
MRWDIYGAKAIQEIEVAVRPIQVLLEFFQRFRVADYKIDVWKLRYQAFVVACNNRTNVRKLREMSEVGQSQTSRSSCSVVRGEKSEEVKEKIYLTGYLRTHSGRKLYRS